MRGYPDRMRFVVRLVVQAVALVAVVVFAVVFFNVRSDVSEQASQITGSTVPGTPSSLAAGSGMYGSVSLVGGADYNLDAVVAARPVVFWFWAPG